jgi:hypothetical protein
MSSHKRKTVLFNDVLRKRPSNTIFALSLELLAHSNIDVHVASFPGLRQRAEGLLSSAKVGDKKHPDSSFTFHDIGGIGFAEANGAKGLSGASTPHPPLARSHNEGINKLIILLTIWNGQGTPRHLYFTSPTRIEYQLLMEMAAVVLRICQSG